MDIFEHLKNDHRKVSALMTQIEQTDDEGERQTLFQDLKVAVIRHAKAEEATFYSFLDRYEEMEDLIAEAREDHQMVESLIHDIESLPATSVEWMTHFQELKESIDDHVDQEETEIFEEARMIIDGREADELERRMAKQEAQISTT